MYSSDVELVGGRNGGMKHQAVDRACRRKRCRGGTEGPASFVLRTSAACGPPGTPDDGESSARSVKRLARALQG